MNENGNTTNADPVLENEDLVELPRLVEVPRLRHMNDNLVNVSEQTRTLNRPLNTTKAYSGKETELIQFLDHAYGGDPFCRLLDPNKVYRFLFYQCAREKRLNRRGQRNRLPPRFDATDYENIMRKYDHDNARERAPFIQPKNGLKFQALRQYKAVMKDYFDHQLKHQEKPWEFLWTPHCKKLMNIVRSRGPEQKLKNFEEKVNHSLSPFTIVHRYPDIEEKLFHHGMANMRVAVTQLQNPYVLTHTTSGILRFKTLEKACLSDFLCSIIQKEEDVHPLLVMITQVFTGTLSIQIPILSSCHHVNMSTCHANLIILFLSSTDLKGRQMIPALFLAEQPDTKM